jgi:hypothetical protein
MFRNKTCKRYKEIDNAITCDGLLKKDNTQIIKKPTDNQIVLMKSETVKYRYKNTGNQEDRQVDSHADRQPDKERAARQAAGTPVVDTRRLAGRHVGRRMSRRQEARQAAGDLREGRQAGIKSDRKTGRRTGSKRIGMTSIKTGSTKGRHGFMATVWQANIYTKNILT